MTAAVALGAILAISIIVIIQAFQIAKLQKDRDDQRGDHNTLVGKVSAHAELIKVLQEPDKDKELIIMNLLNLTFPMKYPRGYHFKDEKGHSSVITSSRLDYDKRDPFNEKKYSRSYSYIKPMDGLFGEIYTISESSLETINRIRAEALKEYEEKKPACKKNPRCKKSSDEKKKGGKK